MTQQETKSNGLPHCKHPTAAFLTSIPPRHLYACCFCGEQTAIVMKGLAPAPDGHGEYLPDIFTAEPPLSEELARLLSGRCPRRI